MRKVQVREESVSIPTYAIEAYDKNPMFLEKRVYQGSSGKVYPHPVCEGVSSEKAPRTYKAVVLENDYLLQMIQPELYDKTNDYDAVYYNEVIKPALVGLAGPWISGGIEFNWPQHHRPSTFDPVDYTIRENPDGSASVFVCETEKMFKQKSVAAFTLYPDRAYVEIKGRLYNPTDRPQTFLWWANPAVPVNDYTRSIFPPDVTAVADHGKRDVSAFPIAKGVYYKYDYAPGTDISRYKNIPVPTSYMAWHSDYDFIGNYDDQKQAGLLHVADHHISPGKKQWTWGSGDFGKAWDRNLTDENGPYIELMTGVYTDNQPDFTFLKPYEEKTFTQYFFPYKDVGAVKNASEKIVMNLEGEGDGLRIALYSPLNLKALKLSLYRKDKVLFCETVSLSPLKTYEKTLSLSFDKPEELLLTVEGEDGLYLSCRPLKEKETPVPDPAEAIPAPEKLKSREDLFLAAVHLEQYRHATRSPGDYYREGLRRDPTDSRLNLGYGKYLYGKGLAEDSEGYFRAAVRSLTRHNPNPYDCEAYYALGLALSAQGKKQDAYDAFYKAIWDGAMQDKGFYQLACLTARKDPARALDFAEKSLVKGLHNLKARILRTCLLRHLGQRAEAEAFNEETLRIDPLCHAAYYERLKLRDDPADKKELLRLLREDPHNAVELSLYYSPAGFEEEAVEILRLHEEADDPLLHYYLFALTDDPGELEKAEKASSLYCFPNRLEDIPILKKAVRHGGHYAGYYLGNPFYYRGLWQEAVRSWEDAAKEISLPTVWRKLALAYYNKEGKPEKAKKALEAAFAADESDARVLFELDQLYKMLKVPVKKRLAHLEKHLPLLETRDDLYTEYLSLLNLAGRHKEAYDRILSHHFHPWEGGEGKVPAQYKIALTALSEEASGKEKEKLLKEALHYPDNIGEGKLIGTLDNDLYYKLGLFYEENGEREKAEDAFRLAARGPKSIDAAQYYYDQPPEMTYFAARAEEKLGRDNSALFDAFIDYAEQHIDDEQEIDYFAVSLPDFLVFEADLQKQHRIHCLYMKALGLLGKGEAEKAAAAAREGAALDPYHYGFKKITEKRSAL